MKKYYYITLIAMVATVCLQISYMFSLYNHCLLYTSDAADE